MIEKNGSLIYNGARKQRIIGEETQFGTESQDLLLRLKF